MGQRISTLEQVATKPAETVHVWANTDQTADEALAASFPDGVPPGLNVIVYLWATAEEVGRANGEEYG
jgi:hypothetical protein